MWNHMGSDVGRVRPPAITEERLAPLITPDRAWRPAECLELDSRRTFVGMEPHPGIAPKGRGDRAGNRRSAWRDQSPLREYSPRIAVYLRAAHPSRLMRTASDPRFSRRRRRQAIVVPTTATATASAAECAGESVTVMGTKVETAASEDSTFRGWGMSGAD